MSKHPSPGQPNRQPKLTLFNRIQNALPKGYYVRGGATAFFKIYKTGRKDPIIEWPNAVCKSWVETRDEVEKIVHFAIKHWERRNP